QIIDSTIGEAQKNLQTQNARKTRVFDKQDERREIKVAKAKHKYARGQRN
ncbi:MAG: hypothetical protein HN878_03120, partial [Candidatus Diapherotrites archaeon]|nr:hypothetical protein [Candidatus Diapherotrites archaeon]